MMKKRIRIIIISTALLLIAGVVCYTFRKSPDSVCNLKPDYQIEASVLVNEFSNNENLANKKYLDKTVQLSGRVLKTENNSDDKTTVYVEGSKKGNISCQFARDELKKARIQEGNTIVVKGKCTGFILDVVLTKCALVE